MHILKGVVWEDDAFRIYGFRVFLERHSVAFYLLVRSTTNLLMKKIIILLLAAFVLASAITAQEKRPNILFVFSDDHAPHAIGAYDGWLKSVNPTPVIDRLAAEGMLFANSFCTNSICGPSRAVIQTGKHSHKNGFMNNGTSAVCDQQVLPTGAVLGGAVKYKNHIRFVSFCSFGFRD